MALSDSEVEIANYTGYYKFTWKEPGIQVKVSRIREKNDTTTAELLFEKLGEDFEPDEERYRARINLLVPRSLKELAGSASSAFSTNGFNWVEAINLIARRSIGFYRVGEPYKDISSTDAYQRTEYLAYPFVPKNHPAILFGLSGSCKSMFALAIGIILQSNAKKNRMGITPKEQAKVMYLDWEGFEDDFRWRVASICKGLGIPREVTIGYRRGQEYLSDDIEAIQEIIHDKGINFIIVDSIGAACGGDLNTSDRAISFLKAVRSLGVSSLLIAHPPKAVEEYTRHTPMGHSYFTNLARLIWEVESAYDEEDEDGTVTIALTNTNTNIDRTHRPRAYQVKIDNTNDVIAIREVEIADSVFNKKLSLSVRIIRELRPGPLSTSELADHLGNKVSSVNTTLHRMRRDGKVVMLNLPGGHKWGISAEAIDSGITPATFGLKEGDLWGKGKDV